MASMGRKDAFPGADGSTITQETGTSQNATTIPIYGVNGNSLTEGSTGLKRVDITTSGVLSKNTSQVYSIKNPLSFIYNANEPRDWYTDNETYQNNTLWVDDTKTNYDPCPSGWRVPTDASRTFGDFSITTFLYYIQGKQTSLGNSNVTNGRLYNQISWFPAEGYRSYVQGNFYSVGTNGYCRSSTISDVKVKVLYFNMEGIYPHDTNRRAYGLPVRCIQE